MSSEQALEFIEAALYTKTSKKLTLVEKEIFKAAWENQTYTTVATNLYLSVGHVKDVAYKLWQLLSDILGEKVTKTNLRLLLAKLNVASNTYPPPE